MALLRPWRLLPSDSALTYAPPFLANAFLPNIAFNGLNLVPPIVVPTGAGSSIFSPGLNLSGYRNFAMWAAANNVGMNLEWVPTDPAGSGAVIGAAITLGAIGNVSPGPAILFGNSAALTNIPFLTGFIVVHNTSGGAITLQLLSGVLCSSQ